MYFFFLNNILDISHVLELISVRNLWVHTSAQHKMKICQAFLYVSRPGAGSGTSSRSLYGRNWEGNDVATGFPG